jgi:hypothetical protein
MQRQVVRLTRQELYEKMWLRPAISLAEEFGISGRGLGKICSRFEIPVPPRAYWAKLAAGKHLTKAPLPTVKSDFPSEILIQPSPEGLAATLPEQVRAEVTTVLESRDQIQVPETLRSPHPIVKRWLEQKRERQKVDQLSDRRSEPPLDVTERRKLGILSAVFSEIEKLGHAVKEARGEVYFEIGAQRLDYKVSEPYKQVQIQLSDEERRRSWNPAIATRTDLEATGELCFEITTYISEPIRKRWRDGKRKKLEEQNLAVPGSSMVTEPRLAFENVVREFGLKSNSGPRILSGPLNIGDNCFCPSEKIGIDDQAGGWTFSSNCSGLLAPTMADATFCSRSTHAKEN